jgi:hypothetical protein
MADDKLDAQGIMEKLRQLLADLEQSLPPSDWYVTINASLRPTDGRGRDGILFTVTSATEEDDDD